MPDDPNWPRASTWLLGKHEPNPSKSIAVLGAPLHLSSITPGRCDLAPGAIRAVLHTFSTFDVESGTDVQRLAATDLGDLDLADVKPEDALEPLSQGLRKALEGADVVAVLGGDNSVTRPGVHAVGDSLGRIGLLTLDAHHDLRDLEGGLSNGNPIRALLADGLPGENIVQIGIQSFANSAFYAEVAEKAGISVVTIDAVRSGGIEPVVAGALTQLSARCDEIYVDLDLDVLDRVFAPAAPGSRPGGLTPWELRQAAFLCGREPKVRALDLVEMDPTKDVADATTLAAASCLLSFSSGLADRVS
ncbi:MAG: agmatinase family protein [Actinomycetota bacterium]